MSAKYRNGRCPVCGDDGTEPFGSPVGLRYYARVAIYDQDTEDELSSEAALCYCGNCGSWSCVDRLVAPGSASDNNRRDEIIRLLDCMSDDERTDIFAEYCTHCGDKDPRCQCWNDE